MCWYAGSRYVLLPQFAASFYFFCVMGYAFRKTGICPLEIMVCTSINRWPRAFGRMYGGKAVKMMWIYFSFGALVIAKAILLLVFGIGWVVHLVR
jgi:hypothetical protein